MYCKYCGRQISDTAVTCPSCGGVQTPGPSAQGNYQQAGYQQAGYQQGGYQQGGYQQGGFQQGGFQQGGYPPQGYQQYPAPDDTGSFGWAVLGFFIPLAGLILYLIWKDEKPNNAKAAGKGALVSVIISVVFTVISTIAGIAIINTAMRYY